MSLWYTYDAPIGWVIQLGLRGGVTCLAFMSQLANQDVSHPGRPWQLKLHLIPLQKLKFYLKWLQLVPFHNINIYIKMSDLS